MNKIVPLSCRVVVLTDSKGNPHSDVIDCKSESCPTSAANPGL